MTYSKHFQFDGDVASHLGTEILSAILTCVTFGIGYPWALVMKQRWIAEHTIIDGRRTTFIGKGSELLVQWIGWMFLIVVTLGIYALWVGPKLQRWIVENTDFAEGYTPAISEAAYAKRQVMSGV